MDDTNNKLLAMIKSLSDNNDGWQKQSTEPTTEIQAVSIPISLETPNGKIRVYLQLPGSVANTPEQLFAAINKLVDKGLPLDFWRQKEVWNKGGGKWSR